ncbi:MAG: hypothetical protein IPN76_25160 [Saprospiraceae bacterium]|nr:hypothetical protein [Saprospiraceae bacterium]
MKLKHLLFFCVASYAGGALFMPLQTQPSASARAKTVGAVSPAIADALATQVFFTENNPILQAPQTWVPKTPLLQAHAHNDYEHERPLFDALNQGFTHIEVDVHLIGNEIYVSHYTPLYLSNDKTLRTLYLEPLDLVVRSNGGSVFPSDDLPLHLMIDIKTEAAATYEALKTYLQPYQHLLTSFKNGMKTERAITVFLSGNRPVQQILEAQNTLMCLDGRIEDLGKGIPPHLMPMVSERFSSVFGWEVLGEARTEHQWQVLKRLAKLVHGEGKKLRLWASPEDEAVWGQLLSSGCDLINTDELERLRQFLLRRSIGIAAR